MLSTLREHGTDIIDVDTCNSLVVTYAEKALEFTVATVESPGKLILYGSKFLPTHTLSEFEDSFSNGT